MKLDSLWNNDVEIKFFRDALTSFASPEQLFYHMETGYYAYIPNQHSSEGQTLQSRNSLIGSFTEKWTKELLQLIAKKHGLYAVNGVVCEEIGLNSRSSADLAFCTENSTIQKAENIKLLFEIKMSIVSNYSFNQPDEIMYLGDYKTHKGNPSLLRSDSMLKAIGKSINIRVSGIDSTSIPIIILGNSPITESYLKKVDFLKSSGVIQGFWSLYPEPTKSDFIKSSAESGFRTIEDIKMLSSLISEILNQKLSFFSSMLSRKSLGKIIQLANQEKDYEDKAEKFLELIKGAK